jgi:2-dehydropantoate 2-reductase
MRILVVGAGSTGGYFGGRLAQSGRDITFLVRPGRAAQIRANGLQIVSPHGDVTLAPKLVTAPELKETFDAVLLTVKAFGLDAALDDLAPAIGPETMILPVLNGMKHVDTLTARFGAHAVAGCAAKIATLVDDQGRIVQLTKLQDIAYGEMDGTASPRILRLDEAMRGAGFDARLSSGIEQEMWEKWILLATVGGINCLMRGTIGEVAAAPGGTEFILGFLHEVTAVIAASGRKPAEAFTKQVQASLTDKSSSQTTSMFRDLLAGRPVEADQIIGDLAARARGFDIATPLLDAAFSHLSIYQFRLNAMTGQSAATRPSGAPPASALNPIAASTSLGAAQ